MYEHRYRERKRHGEPDLPLYLYKVEHPAHVRTILPVHWHNEMEIIYLREGAARFQIESRPYVIHEGEALIVHPGELHSGVNDTGDSPVCYYSIVFKLSWLSSHHTDRIQNLYLGPLIQGTTRLPPYLSASQESMTETTLLDYIRRFITTYEHRLTAYEMILKGLLTLLVAEIYQADLIEHTDVPDKHRDMEENEQVKKVLGYMEEHFREKVQLDHLAAVVSLSRSHFCTFFKRHTGMRPMEYLNYIRVNQAADLLRDGSYNVLEAALESGYQHVSYFTKWFKQFMSMTPSEYREMYQADL